MRSNGVTHALCVSVNLETLPQVLAITERFPNIFASVGVHPNEHGGEEPDIDRLVALASHPRAVAIGETGLDYYRLEGDPEPQRERFRQHIRAAKRISKPLIIHTRAATQDTLKIMQEENVSQTGGVMHCFTESQEVADVAMEMNFLISFSGILTFRNAKALKDVARNVPLDHMLIETDSPYLAPAPYRGKTNQPAYVRFVAEEIAQIKNLPVETIARTTTENFFRLFKDAV